MASSGDNGNSVIEQSASTKPYLIRAIHEWSLDNGFTPQVLVATDHEQVSVPWEHVKDNRIVLNIHPQSVKHLEIGNEYILCSARFSGKPFDITVPVYSVQAIYAKENGQGVVFQEDENSPPPSTPPLSTVTLGTDTSEASKKPKSPGNNGGSHLKLVK